MFDKDQRQSWEWGNVAKSFFTHQQDRGYTLTNKSIAVPGGRWLSIQILNRTIWKYFKHYLTESNRQNNIQDLNHLALCKNCGEYDEHTDHLFVQCTLANKSMATNRESHNLCNKTHKLW